MIALAPIYLVSSLNSRTALRLAALQEATMLLDLFKAATPVQLALVYRHIGTAITHVGAPVGQDINRLNDHESLQVDPVKQ